MERKKNRSSSDGLAQVKAAAWAWYQHGSGSEGKPMREFDITRTERASSYRPSRYKLEAMRNNTNTGKFSMEEEEGSASQTQNSLLDSYETESISKRLSDLIEFSGIKFYDELLGIDDHDYQKKLSSRDGDESGSGRGRKKQSKNYLKRLLLRHAVVCGRRQDVDDRAFRDDRRRPGKQIVNR